MLLSDILSGIEIISPEIPDISIENITAKVSEIKSSSLFIFYKPHSVDINTVLKKITEKLPAVILTDIEITEKLSIPVIRVKNARRAYSYVMFNFCNIDTKKLKFYGVTGSNGKTTTATMLYKIFRKANVKCGFIGTGKILINDEQISDTYYSMTTPDPDLLYPIIKKMELCGCEKIVMEVSSHALSLFKISPITFECAMFTNLTHEHLDFHKNTEEYFQAKLSLFRQSRIGIFNVDDAYGSRAFLECAESISAISTGIKKDADVMAKETNICSLFNLSFIYREKDVLFKVVLNIGGEYNVSNALLAIKCALSAGIRKDIIQSALEAIRNIEGRLEIVNDEPCVIIDYAHTPAALESVLNFIYSTKKTEQKIVSIFGCGGDRDREKRAIMAKISEKYSALTYITDDNSRSEDPMKILCEIEAGFSKNANYFMINDRESAISEAILKSDKNDIILIIGKGHERYNIDADGYHSFNEKEIIEKALSERKTSK